METKQFARKILGDKADQISSDMAGREIKEIFYQEMQALLDKYEARINPDDKAFYLKNLPTIQCVYFPNHIWFKKFKK